MDKLAAITLGSWRANDLALLRRIQADPEMTKHLGGPEPDDKIPGRLTRYIASQGPDGRMFKILADGEPAGSVGYWEKTWHGTTVYEIGWNVLPEFQGHGIATKAAQLAIERAREDGLHREIHAFPATENAASNGLCERLGFELRGEHDFEYPPGNWLRCNDWALKIDGPGTAHPRRTRSEPGKEEGPP